MSGLELASLRLCPILVCTGAKLALLVEFEAVGVLVPDSSSSAILGKGMVVETTSGDWCRRASSNSDGADCMVVSLSGDSESDTSDIFADVTFGGEVYDAEGLLFAVVLPLCRDSNSSRSFRTDGLGGGLDIFDCACVFLFPFL